ncbi:3-phosphoshikimate 1-carboxyvinyltransferase [Desulfovibrio sp. OttesenSCG-928-G11]|nr:3-phosphoshikimate 1-carboxyvinyltransferase [Desulfovibrio sp. OttesenSCG-928-G11]
MRIITVTAPPSKSLSHRYLVAAGLAGGQSRLEHVLESDDSARTMDCLAALGVVIKRLEPGVFTVAGLGGGVSDRPGTGKGRGTGAESGRGAGVGAGKARDQRPLPLFVGESGSTCRLLTAVAAAGRGCFWVHGAGRMHERPLGELAGALVSLGASFAFAGHEGCPPFTLKTGGLDSARLPKAGLSISCDESSQYLSGLLLAAPLIKGGLRLLLGGKKAVSWPYVSLTLDTLERFGIVFSVEELADGVWKMANWRKMRRGLPGKLRFNVAPGLYRAGKQRLEGDFSSASYFLAAGAVGPNAVRVQGLKEDSLQADAAILPFLRAMGARVVWEGDSASVYPGPLRGLEADLGQCPDLAPTLAALAAHAEGRSVLGNAAHLALKESNRLEAPAQELRKAGCLVRVMADGLVVEPALNGPRLPDAGRSFSAHGDHRLAMSLALLGLAGRRAKGFAVPLDDAQCVAKSFPGFWREWAKITGAPQDI